MAVVVGGITKLKLMVDNGKVDFSLGLWTLATQHLIAAFFFYKDHAHPSWAKMSKLLEPRKSLKGPSLHNL